MPVYLVKYLGVITAVSAPRNSACYLCRKNLVKSIRDFIRYAEKDTSDIIDVLKNSTSEPWDTEEEYLDYIDDKQEEANWVRERQNLHKNARESWKNEKRSRRIVKELEKKQHEFEIPEKPEVTEDIKKLNEKYAKGEITIFEFEQKIESILESN